MNKYTWPITFLFILMSTYALALSIEPKDDFEIVINKEKNEYMGIKFDFHCSSHFADNGIYDIVITATQKENAAYIIDNTGTIVIYEGEKFVYGGNITGYENEKSPVENIVNKKGERYSTFSFYLNKKYIKNSRFGCKIKDSKSKCGETVRVYLKEIVE
ncbi:MAG: hypothetical protein AB1724_02750 [Thermodesulfobacteriota bacterium]